MYATGRRDQYEASACGGGEEDVRVGVRARARVVLDAEREAEELRVRARDGKLILSGGELRHELVDRAEGNAIGGLACPVVGAQVACGSSSDESLDRNHCVSVLGRGK